MTPDDAASGWNWTFWRRVLRPVVSELASPDVQPALVAPDAALSLTHPSDVELVARRAASHLYVIAVRTGGAVSRLAIGGLPRSVTRGDVLAEWAQQPLPPGAGHQAPRAVTVTDGVVHDWFAAYDAHVYRFTV